MSKKEQLLADLFEVTAKELLRRIKNKEASPSDIKNAIQWLKDNSITVEVRKGHPLAALAEALPFTSEDLDGSTH